jgi:hypothetical protein
VSAWNIGPYTLQNLSPLLVAFLCPSLAQESLSAVKYLQNLISGTENRAREEFDSRFYGFGVHMKRVRWLRRFLGLWLCVLTSFLVGTGFGIHFIVPIMRPYCQATDGDVFQRI